jgi:hypothetical protein
MPEYNVKQEFRKRLLEMKANIISTGEQTMIKLYCKKCGVRLWLLPTLSGNTTLKELEGLCICENCKINDKTAKSIPITDYDLMFYDMEGDDGLGKSNL